MRIIQISDSHIAHDIPQRLQDLDDCVAAVNEEEPDLVIHSGDITHNGLADEYSAARQRLDELHAPYFVLNGNKDVRSNLRDTFRHHAYLSQSTAPDDFIQYSLEEYPWRLIMIDTVEESKSKGKLCKKRLEHLANILGADTSKPAVIFMHHSPFVVNEIPDPNQFSRWEDVDEFGSLLSRYSNVAGIYCGHVHRNVNGTLNDVPVHVLSCIATDLRKGKLSTEDKTRPMYRVIDLPDNPDN